MTIDIAAVAAQAGQAVVGIQAGGGRGGGRAATGTVTDTDIIVTTAHNVGWNRSSEQQRPVTVIFADGRREDGRVVAVSEDLDLAVVTATTGEVQPLPWSTDAQIDVGSEIVAIAAPQGIIRVTAGAVASADSRLRTRTGAPVDDVIDHTAPLPRGASGGPVLDASGAVIGINVNRLTGGLYQAISAGPELTRIVTDLAQGIAPVTPVIGVTLMPGRNARHLRAAVGLDPLDGVLITDVAEGSAASEAGLSRGDLLVTADDHSLRSSDELLLALRRGGNQMVFGVVRGAGEPRTVTVALVRPDGTAPSQ